MGAAVPIIGAVAGVLSAGASVMGAIRGKPKAPKIPPQLAPPRMNGGAVADTLSRRSGVRDNQRTGMGGTEYSGGKKSKLGS